MKKGISLVALACLFFGSGELALAKKNSPHFFRKIARPEASFQRAGSTGFFPASDFPNLFEELERPAKRLFGKKLDFSFFLNNIIPVKRLFSLSGVKRIRVNIEVDIVFKDENK